MYLTAAYPLDFDYYSGEGTQESVRQCRERGNPLSDQLEEMCRLLPQVFPNWICRCGVCGVARHNPVGKSLVGISILIHQFRNPKEEFLDLANFRIETPFMGTRHTQSFVSYVGLTN